MATSALSGRELSKSFLPVASALKAFPVATPQADSAGPGEAAFSETATFSEALKAARRPLRESFEKPDAKPEKPPKAEKEGESESETQTDKEADGVREKPTTPVRSADRRRSKEGAEKSSRQSSNAVDAHRDQGPQKDDPTRVQAPSQAASQDKPSTEKPVSAKDQPGGETGTDDPAAKDAAPANVGAAVDPAAQAAVVSAQVMPAVTAQVAAPATPAPATPTDAPTETQAATATVQAQTPRKIQGQGEKADKKPGGAKPAKTDVAEQAIAKKDLRQPLNPDDDAAEQPGDEDNSTASNKPQHPQNMSAFSKAAAKIASGNDTADAAVPGEPPAPTTHSPAMQVMQSALAETLATPPRTEAPAEHDAPKPVAGTPAISGNTGSTSATAANESADAAAPAQQSPASDSDQTFEQVVMGLRGKLDPRSGKAEIRLDPPNLGTLHVSVQLSNGSLTPQFQSSSDVVRDLLKSNMEKLKSVLQGQGVTVDKLAVESPSDKVVTAAAKMPASGSPNNDGRSAGQYTRDPQSGQKRTLHSANGSRSFARLWRDATTADAPIDLVG